MSSFKKLIKSQVYDNKLYLLAQNAENNQISYSVYTLDLNNPTGFDNLFKSNSNITHKSHFYSEDFIVNSDGIFVVGTTDYAPSDVSQGGRTYDYFLSKYKIDGSLDVNFGVNGIFQKKFLGYR